VKNTFDEIIQSPALAKLQKQVHKTIVRMCPFKLNKVVVRRIVKFEKNFLFNKRLVQLVDL
jgi:hypothetical protein